MDLQSGQAVAKFQFLPKVEEIFAVDLIPEYTNVVVSGVSQDEQQQEIGVGPQSAVNVPSTL